MPHNTNCKYPAPAQYTHTSVPLVTSMVFTSFLPVVIIHTLAEINIFKKIEKSVNFIIENAHISFLRAFSLLFAFFITVQH